MSERGMGSAVGQVPEYIEMVTRWCKAHTRMPVFVKLTPNVTSILGPARAAKKGGADAVSLINTVNSIMSVDLDALAPTPTVGRSAEHTSELQSLMRISYAVSCLKKTNTTPRPRTHQG